MAVVRPPLPPSPLTRPGAFPGLSMGAQHILRCLPSPISRLGTSIGAIEGFKPIVGLPPVALARFPWRLSRGDRACSVTPSSFFNHIEGCLNRPSGTAIAPTTTTRGSSWEETLPLLPGDVRKPPHRGDRSHLLRVNALTRGLVTALSSPALHCGRDLVKILKEC